MSHILTICLIQGFVSGSNESRCHLLLDVTPKSGNSARSSTPNHSLFSLCFLASKAEYTADQLIEWQIRQANSATNAVDALTFLQILL